MLEVFLDFMSTNSVWIRLLYLLMALLSVIYIYRTVSKQKQSLIAMGKFISRYLYMFLLAPAVFLLIYDLIGNPDLTNEVFKRRYDVVLDFSKIIFSAGIFSASIQFLDSMNVFKKNFEDIIISDNFKNLISENIEKLAYSEEHLLKQGNLNDIWETVTLCKYKKDFNEIHLKLKKKITNDYFDSGSISYYHKNFQVNYKIDLIDNDHLKIEETCSFTIVRPNKEKFNFEFKHKNIIIKDNDKDTVEVGLISADFSVRKEGEYVLEEIKKDTKEIDGYIVTEMFQELKDKKEYHIEGKVVMAQNLNDDREYGFGSQRIIDDLTVSIEHDPKICVIFSPVGKDRIMKNGAFPNVEHSYINRDVLLPGEKFKLFFYKR